MLSVKNWFQHYYQHSETVGSAVAQATEQIVKENAQINAICTQRAKTDIDADLRNLSDRFEQNLPVGMLAAMPYLAKDTHATANLRTTRGSPIFADWIPDYNDTVVQRYIDADAVLIGKSNTPEFAAGSQTFNTIFGATKNPFDITKTAGGSSGGAAAALATGMTALACGSDLAASLRNPAAFCGVVGFLAHPFGPMSTYDQAPTISIRFRLLGQWVAMSATSSYLFERYLVPQSSASIGSLRIG
jgi:amidase